MLSLSPVSLSLNVQSAVRMLVVLGVMGVKVIPDRFIGWDVAITPNGPIIVEANRGPHLLSCEMGYGGLLRNQHIKKLVEELKQ